MLNMDIEGYSKYNVSSSSQQVSKQGQIQK